MSFLGTIYPKPGQEKIVKKTNGQKKVFFTKILV